GDAIGRIVSARRAAKDRTENGSEEAANPAACAPVLQRLGQRLKDHLVEEDRKHVLHELVFDSELACQRIGYAVIYGAQLAHDSLLGARLRVADILDVAPERALVGLFNQFAAILGPGIKRIQFDLSRAPNGLGQ